MGIVACRKCKKEFPQTEEYFYRNNDSFRRVCKDCVLEQNKNYVKKNKEKVCKRRRTRYSEASKTRHRKRIETFRYKYKITEKEVQALLDSQKGCCAICKKSLVFPDSKKSYAVDHNHETGEVRGLLCGECNKALGLMKESKEAILQMLNYIS